MPHSHHSHSGQFCKHAVGSLEDVVREAVRRGFDVYGLTEHVPRYRPSDLYPEEEEKNLTPEDLSQQFDAYLNEAHRLRALYAPQISLLVGLETEYITELDLERLEESLRGNAGRVEYVVGSVHHVNGIPIDFDEATFRRAVASMSADLDADDLAPINTFLCAYFDAQYEVLQRIHPEVVGHLDLCRLYTPHLRFADYPAALSRAIRNIRYAIEYGALFEVNAAALRKNWATPYPGADLLSIILSNGGRLALSDDSHGPHAVGLNYDKLPGYLRSLGVTELWHFAKSETPNAAGRHVQPVRIQGDWAAHPFWAQLS